MTDSTTLSDPDPAPSIERIRHETRRRLLTVSEVTRLSPHMIRIEFRGDELGDFVTAAFDDHIKIFFPTATGETVGRDFTPRLFQPDRLSLTVDFVDHPGGPAAEWARTARGGDRLEVGGPRGSRVVSGPIDRWILIGDETALPAIGRQIETLPQETAVTSLVAVPSASDRQEFPSRSALDADWIVRPLGAAEDPSFFLRRLDAIEITERTFIWIAAEAGVARALRTHFVEMRRHAPQWLKSAGYWVKGEADSAIKDLDAVISQRR